MPGLRVGRIDIRAASLVWGRQEVCLGIDPTTVAGFRDSPSRKLRMAKVVLGVREAPPGATGTGAKQGASSGEDRRHLHERALASVRFAALAVWRTQIPTNCWRQMFEDEFGHCGFRRGTKCEPLAALAEQQYGIAIRVHAEAWPAHLVRDDPIEVLLLQLAAGVALDVPRLCRKTHRHLS